MWISLICSFMRDICYPIFIYNVLFIFLDSVSMDTQCQHSEKVETDSGNTVCTDCGVVLQDSNIVTELQYTQDSSGVSKEKAVGKLVSCEG